MNGINTWLLNGSNNIKHFYTELQIKNNRIMFGSTNSEYSDDKADPNQPE